LNSLPSASVIVPTYNRSGFIERAFASLVEQDYPKDTFEIIAIDDGSTDRTPEILKRFCRDHTYFRSLSQANKGPAAARNLGIREANGDIVLLMDDDCIAEKNWARELAGSYRSDNIGGVAGRIKFVASDNNIANQFAAHDIGSGQPLNAAGEIDFFVTANASFRRKVIEQVGGFDETFPYAAHEDVDLSHRVRRAGWRLLYHDAAVVDHYHHHNIRGDLKKGYQVGNSEALYQLKHGDDLQLLNAVTECLLSFGKTPLSIAKYLTEGLGLRRSLAFPLLHRLHKLMVTSGKIKGYYSYRNSFNGHGSHVNQ